MKIIIVKPAVSIIERNVSDNDVIPPIPITFIIPVVKSSITSTNQPYNIGNVKAQTSALTKFVVNCSGSEDGSSVHAIHVSKPFFRNFNTINTTANPMM